LLNPAQRQVVSYFTFDLINLGPAWLLNMAHVGTVRCMPNTIQNTQTTLPPSVKVDGAAVRARRIELGETIVSFAPRVPMSVGYLSQIERGRKPRRMSPPRFRQLAQALGMADRADELKAAA
jgi:hypothetical protein